MWLRQQKGKALPLEEIIDYKDASPSVQERYEGKELQAAIKSMLSRISLKNRLASTLHYIDGYSYKEIADFLGVSISTVKSRLHEAKKQLKQETFRLLKGVFKGQRLPEDFTEKVISTCGETCQCGMAVKRR